MANGVRRSASLSTWRLTNSKLRRTDTANTGTEFAGADAPKMKFLYTLSFQYRDPQNPLSAEGSDQLAHAEFACKTATRPNINIVYNDVNAYNYRFKVATRTDYGTVTISFYDDNKNTAHNLFEEYLRAVSPVANMSLDDFKNETLDITNFSSFGPLTHKDGPIVSMRLTHHYNSEYRDSQGYYSSIAYDFVNPKIQTMTWDELDMSSSDAPLLTMTLVYDAVLIAKDEAFASPSASAGTVTVNNGNTDDGDEVENVR